MADVTGTFYAGNAFVGYGTEVKVGQGDASPEDFVAIPDVESIQFGDMTTGIVDKTHLRSPGRHREKLATIRDSGPIIITANYRPEHGAHKIAGGDGFATGRSLVALWQNVTEANFQIKLPADANDLVLDVRGTITRYQIGTLGIDQKVPVTIEITPLQDYSDGLPA